MSETDRQQDRVKHHRAEVAWTEVREDEIPELVYETDHGTTVAVELSPEAAGQLRDDFLTGPTVRHDLEGEQ